MAGQLEQRVDQRLRMLPVASASTFGIEQVARVVQQRLVEQRDVGGAANRACAGDAGCEHLGLVEPEQELLLGLLDMVAERLPAFIDRAGSLDA